VQNWLGKADQYYMEWAPSVPIIAISESARAEVTHPLNFVGVVHHGLPMDQFRPTGKKPGDFFIWLGRFAPEKGADRAVEAAKKAGVPVVLAGTIDRHTFTDATVTTSRPSSTPVPAFIKTVVPVPVQYPAAQVSNGAMEVEPKL